MTTSVGEVKASVFSTDMLVVEDPKAREYVLTLDGRELVRVPYSEVYAARRRWPEDDVKELVLGLFEGR